eukprot:Skav221735  [mRNA]  locus=scaffold542:436715:438121:- [translate_table: standard]
MIPTWFEQSRPVYVFKVFEEDSVDAMEKLIGALAEKLPAHAGRSTVELAFRAAVDALPKSKLKDRVLVKREQLIGRLLVLVRQKTVEEANEVAEEPQDVDKDFQLHSCYQDVDTDKPRDCLKHCRSLVQDALVSLDPAARAEEALGGLVALFPPERTDWKLDIGDLQTLVQILTLAAATRGLQDTVAWKRFLGFVISAVLRLDAANGMMNEVQRLGCTTALLVQQPSVARAAVRIATSSEYGSRDQCVRLVPILAPLLRTGFLRGGGKTHRGDLLALLSGLRFLQLATMSGLHSDKLAEIRKILTTAFSRDYDATPMLPELQRIAENHARLLKRGKAILRKMQNAAKTSSTSTTVEIIEALAKELQQQELARLVGFSGLPAGDDEQIDANAAAARARGDLFFEDTSGDVPLESLLKGGSSATQDAILQVQKRKFGNLDGVEDIDVDDASKSPKASKAKHEVSKSSKAV